MNDGTQPDDTEQKPNHSCLSLRIFGDDLDPDTVSQMMKIQPTRSHRKGDLVLGKAGKPYWNEHLKRHSSRKTGAWILETAERSPADLEAQIFEVLALLPSDVSVWEKLAETCRADLLVGWFMTKTNEVFDLSAEVVQLIAVRRIKLSFDLYDVMEKRD
jgi:hypothetical protein